MKGQGGERGPGTPTEADILSDMPPPQVPYSIFQFPAIEYPISIHRLSIVNHW